VFVEQFNLDVVRRENGEREVFPDIELAVIELATAQMQQEIKGADVPDIKDGLVGLPPPIFAPGLPPEELPAVRAAVAGLVADNLLANYFPDPQATAAEKEAAANAVPDEKVQYFAEQVILAEGDIVTAVALDAINQLDLLAPEPTTSRNAIVALGGMAVLLAAFFLWRVAPNLWSQPRHFALLGILLVLAAAATRIPEIIVTEDNTAIAYILPAVMFGYMGAILYDPRTALLLAIPVATFTAISSADPALTIFAAGATVVPVAFVSAVSSRRELRLAVGMSALVLAPLAASVAWLFDDADAALPAAAFAVVGGVVGGLVAQGLLSFLENLFRMTTTLTLLDLTDRNHPGLRLLEDKAPGTFNHSILVGTLAGKAARAIGASPLLAQAAAYYHDLGKTENPQYFIENQFGVSNPHDEIDPIESANIIRRHVLEGERLARQLRIPETVADGIRMHHGTGLMRYFYHQALEIDSTIDPDDFRHHGAKPRRKEMAILMISDAVEGAARSLAQHEDPTAASLVKMVDSVVGEKLEDGQLDESDLTFGDLTRVKQALVDALIGYYHTRIPYPGFPGTAVEGR
jgi:putative nucleotidyltransferase with HDIG domain